MKRVRVRAPSGRIAIRIKKRRVGAARCSNCKRELHGAQRLHVVDIRGLAKSKLKPTRAYGGNMCGSCTRELFREKARAV